MSTGLTPQPTAAEASARTSAQTSPNQSVDQDLEKQDDIPEPEPSQPAPAQDPNLITWDGPDDPGRPQNWSRRSRWTYTMLLGSMTFCITFASSVFSTATVVTAIEFDVSNEVMILGTSLFVLGFCFGPAIWAPLSEVFGRRPPLFFGYFVFALFTIGVAVAQNLYTIMICRFFAGLFGCSPLAIVGGQLADFWDPVTRGIALVGFAGATMIGPVAGPIVGGFVTMSYLGWRWTQYLTAIMAFFFGGLAFIFVPESLEGAILSARAKKIRFETKNWAVHAKADEEQIDLRIILEKYLDRPYKMLFTEPILFFLTIYMAIIYGIIYLLFSAFPIAFEQVRGWNLGVGALPFISIIIGAAIGGTIIGYLTLTRFKTKMITEGRVVPEERLVPMIIGGCFFPIGMFWFAWTSDPSIHWAAQVLAGIPIGAGLLMIFMQGLNYIIDCYLMHANSALAANTFIRSLFGAVFPLFATYMYDALGVDWASSLLGFLTLACLPAPILFFLYGARIRSWSKYSPY